MNPLNTPLAPALARALLHFIWEGTLIAGLLGVMLFVLRRAPAQARYAAACAAMIAMAGSFVFTAAAPDAGPSRLPIPVFTAFPATHLAAAGDGRMGPGATLSGWAVGIWLSGVVLLLLRSAGGWLTARRLLSRGSVATGEPWVELLGGLRRRMGIGRAVALMESALVESPAVIGWLRPVILVPAGWLMGLAPADAETVLLHELAHVRRHDYLVNLVQSAIQDLLFYHPAVWWVGRVIRREREHCCDDAVIAVGADRRGYARTLAALEGMRSGEPAMAATGGNLASRIRRLVRPAEGPRASAAPLVLVTMLVCAGAAALHALPAPPAAAAVEAPPQATPLPGTPYEKWLTQDVAYIIQDDERAAFRGLRTNEEREHFIEQFWERRDPTPGTAANEFKEEHYRRIGYANDRFAEGIPGWKTDRGRIYIVYGPPDEKEVHPSGDAGGPPYEEWLYKHIEGIGDQVIVRFVDEQRSGSFRQTRDPRTTPQLVKPPRADLRPLRFAQPLQRPPDVAIAVPRVQPNGDYVYRDGPASVQVGDGGATMISVDGAGARVLLRRIARHDMNSMHGEPPETLLREDAATDRYTRLVTLSAGVYQLEGEVAHDPELQNLRTRQAYLEAQIQSVRKTYTETHPRVRVLVSELEETRAAAQRALERGSRKYRLEFRVP